MKRVLLTGASGYVGGRLLPVLEERAQVRCMARRPDFLRPRVAEGTEVMAGDVLDPDSLGPALEGIDTAYYLIHSMGSDESFEESDRKAALHFAAAARAAGVKKIVYLGGLGHGDDLSEHLASRQEVGRLLRESGVPTFELRAGVIIGSGSLSFALIRALVEKLPIMVVPRWARTPTQPISIEDVVEYLNLALDHDIAESVVYEIGCADRVNYLGLMREYARQRGLRRLLLPVPILSPRISSLWLGLVTPVYARVGRKLIDGLRNETVVHDHGALEAFRLKPRSVEEAIARALSREDQRFAATSWGDALSSASVKRSWAGTDFGSRIVDSRVRSVACPMKQAFRPIERIGGTTGWYAMNWMWRVRGLFDLMLGGPGMRRGRRDPERLVPGDIVDCWRVERIERPRYLRLAAEMKLPGRAWLEFELEEEPDGSTKIRQTAVYDPIGLFGRLYWYMLVPAHFFVFRRMLAGIAAAAMIEKP